jgi:hypothetical protein
VSILQDLHLYIIQVLILIPVYMTKTISSVIITIFAITSMSSLLLFSPMQQQIQLMIENSSSDNYGHDDYYYYHMAFAYHGKEISQKLNYAHFLPLTSNNQTHQVKVVVNYSVTDPSIINNKNMNAIMHVYAPNGRLIKISSFAKGLIINSTSGQSKLATTITNSTLKNVKANVIFTDAEKNANFSEPLDVNLSLGQKIPPPP